MKKSDGYREPKGKWTADLQWANNQDARVERLWSRVFGTASYTKTPDGTAKQRSGCDRVAHVVGGTKDYDVTLEEKVRRMPFTKYNDVLFELQHEFDDGRVEPGWAGKWPSAEQFAWVWLGGPEDQCDWILAIPTQVLKAWFESVVRPQLDKIPKRFFRSSRTNNEGYRTVSLCLPYKKVLHGMAVASRINWPKEAL